MKLRIAAVITLLVVALVAVAASLGVLPGPGAATAATSFLTATASTTDVTDEVAATGTVQPAQTYALSFGAGPVITDAGSASASSSSNGSSSSSNSSSNTSGGASVAWPVTAVNVKVGDRVKKGDVLATAATSDLEAQIDLAANSRSAADISAAQASTNLANATTTTADQAQVAYLNARNADAKAIAAEAALRAQAAFASLVAPADGIVTAVNVRVADTASSSTAISLASSTLQVTTSIVESDIGKISTGQKATVTISAVDASLGGTVSAIAPSGSASGNSGVVSFSVQVLLDAPPDSVRPGMSADVSVVTASATNVLAIPSRALSGSAGNYTVRVMAADGTVAARSVTVGLVTSSLAEIQSGLQAGEQVVTGTSSTQTTVNGTGGGGLGGGGRGVTTFPGGGNIVPGR
jgi:macrolide-specific efflux system membrane fusion protein